VEDLVLEDLVVVVVQVVLVDLLELVDKVILEEMEVEVVAMLVLSGGAVAYGYGYMSVNEAPSLNRNQANQVTAALTFLGRFMSYAS
jgi:hypothetical protein